jgi:hypothetical protein
MNYLSLYLLETFSKNTFFIVRVSCLNGFNIYNLFGFRDLDILVSKESTIKENRD